MREKWYPGTSAYTEKNRNWDEKDINMRTCPFKKKSLREKKRGHEKEVTVGTCPYKNILRERRNGDKRKKLLWGHVPIRNILREREETETWERSYFEDMSL